MDVARRAAVWAGVVSVALSVGCGCEKGDEEEEEEEETQEKVYRVGMPEMIVFSDFNPTAEYNMFTWGLYSNLLLRTLVGYPHKAGADGNSLEPDLATNLGEVSADGLEWTYHLGPDVAFGPPLDRPITSADVLYAFRRMATVDLSAGGPAFYFYGVVVGMDEPLETMPETISGIETPDAHTIVFHLNQPTPDFHYRLSLPVAAPVPEEVAGCFEGNDYGPRLVSSGPYMLLGADQADASDCGGLDPFEGYDPQEALVFVRNPSHFSAARDTAGGPGYSIDRFEFRLHDDPIPLLETGELEGVFAVDADADTIGRYENSPSLQDRIHVGEADAVRYITFNLTQPPFDDVHVRKAVNLVINKAAILQEFGGPTAGDIATHVVPPAMTGGYPTAEEFDPFPSEGFAGDLEAAKAEMRLSAYDSDDDGLCDATVCQDVRHVARDSGAHLAIVPLIEADLAKIGIVLATEELPTGEAYDSLVDVTDPVPISSVPGWGKDYPDAITYFQPLFEGGAIGSCCNYAMVGLTPAQASELGVPGSVSDVPSVDADIDACVATVNTDGRTACWVALDEKITGEVVPWVPLNWSHNVDLIGAAVTDYEYDQFSGMTAFSRVDVDPGYQQP